MRRLYKSRTSRIIDGICGGIAEYFDVDPTIVRVLWIVITLMGGFGFLLYIAAMILMPVNPDFSNGKKPGTVIMNGRKDSHRFWGVLLILLGALALISNLGWFAAFGWWRISWEIVFPITLIILGIWFITMHREKPGYGTSGSAAPAAEGTPPVGPAKVLHRSVRDKKLFGVCGGIAEYFGVDPTFVRILYVVLILISFGWGLLLYIIMAILIPEEKLTAV